MKVTTAFGFLSLKTLDKGDGRVLDNIQNKQHTLYFLLHMTYDTFNRKERTFHSLHYVLQFYTYISMARQETHPSHILPGLCIDR